LENKEQLSVWLITGTVWYVWVTLVVFLRSCLAAELPKVEPTVSPQRTRRSCKTPDLSAPARAVTLPTLSCSLVATLGSFYHISPKTE